MVHNKEFELVLNLFLEGNVPNEETEMHVMIEETKKEKTDKGETKKEANMVDLT